MKLEAASGFDTALINAIASAALIVLAIYLAVTALVKSRGERRGTLDPRVMPSPAEP